MEVLNADDPNNITPIVLYNPNNKKLSLLHLALEKVYGWRIDHVDQSLQKLSRQFEVDRESVYDFLMNEVCEKFNCYIVFDTIENTVNLYAESLTSKFIGDGTTSTFTISPPFAQVATVSVDGYKTTRWEYDSSTGILSLEDVPESGAHIEVVDGALTEWETDVFVAFDNLAQQINIDYDADAIKTTLVVTYGDDLNIRETNMGLPYLTDLSYYYTVDWMGQDLYDAYTAYMQKSNQHQSEYTGNTQKMLALAGRIDFEENRLSLEYSVALSVNETTVGTYYVRGGDAPDYYYTEVSLPEEYDVNTIYYSANTTNVQDGTDGNVSALYSALQKYFYNYFNAKIDSEIHEQYKNGIQEAIDDISDLADRFSFMDGDDYTIAGLRNTLQDDTTDAEKEEYIAGFFNVMWEQIGKTPLKELYYEPYKKAQISHLDTGYSQKDNKNYGYYYVVVLLLNSIEKAIAKRDSVISIHNNQYEFIQQKNLEIANSLVMENNFTEEQMVRLSAFLREDELHLDDIVETSQTTTAESFALKQDAMEAGRIELQKICQPQLTFSMTMANIYALPEFEPIIDQFQLGKVIKVGLRRDYIKQSRLLQVDIGFDDFSDFSCEFGDLTSLRSQSDIHADLLKKAVQAGKSVATNASYWTKGSDQANNIDLRLEEGLLNSIEALKASDGVQNAFLDKYGIHLESINPDTGEVDDKRIWMVNNQIVFTDDGFKTSKTVLGEFTVDNITYYGLLAQAVISGYIEGSQIKGGTIQIGLQKDGTYAFEVHEDGTVTMGGGSSIGGYTASDLDSMSGSIVSTQNTVQSMKDTVDTIASQKMYRVEIQSSGPMIMNTKNQTATLSCKVYSWDTDITDTLDASLFKWIRTSNNIDQDVIWNNNTNHHGRKTLIITTEDITNNANFSCEVSLPE